MEYARVRRDITSDEVINPIDYWLYVEARDLEGQAIHFRPESEWVKAVCCDNELGLYVLTQDDETYFTAYSIDLEFSNILRTEMKEKKMGKHALPYNVHRDIAESENAFIEELGQDLDTWQLIARDLARDITRNDGSTDDAFSFAYDILNRLSHIPEMNIHPSEVRPK
jgi:hypothetical protein